MKCLSAIAFVFAVAAFAAAQTKSEPSPSECPSISITAPAGVPNPNEPLYYFLDIKGELPEGAEIVWTTSSGQILTGQGTNKIGIYNAEDTELKVSVEISGLPKQCPNTASEQANWVIDLTSRQLVEIDNEGFRLDKDAVKSAIETAQENPDDFLFFIQYYRYDTDAFRLRQLEQELKEYLTKELKIKDPFFKFVTKQADKPLMKIYLVPPGAEDPNP